MLREDDNRFPPTERNQSIEVKYFKLLDEFNALKKENERLKKMIK